MSRPAKKLFVGLRVSVGTANALAGAVETLARRGRDAAGPFDLRWVAPVDYHLTLKYLGWTAVEAVGAVLDGLAGAAAGVDRFAFRVARLGGFPSIGKATVLWAGADGGPTLGTLAARVEAAMIAVGYKAEDRAFHPHVTLARAREARALNEVVLPLAEQMFGETRAAQLVLFESETKSSGSVYRELEKITLGSTESRPELAGIRQSDPLHVGTPEPDTDDGWPRGRGPTD
ncbi:MAG TPA: RNA 2',3'-cyclic phosphodiesterase [Kofleriaceae bacterium]|jgi:2'-5' RNA ligase